MSYQSPIELFTSQCCSSIEDAIYKSVLNVGIDVDKEELLKALKYDREQYQKGYDDRDAAIVRCKDCINYNPLMRYCEDGSSYPKPNFYCANGKRR